MKNLRKFIIISSFSLTSLACAQNYGYDQNAYNGNSSNYHPQSYSQPVQYQNDAYQNNGYGTTNRNYQNDYQKANRQDSMNNSANKNANDQGSWSSNWFGSDDKVPAVPNQVISSRVIQNLRSTPYFSNGAKNIQVETVDGKVTLKGKVANKNEKNQIEYMVMNVEGVKSVSNDLETEK